MTCGVERNINCTERTNCPTYMVLYIIYTVSISIMIYYIPRDINSAIIIIVEIVMFHFIACLVCAKQHCGC